MRETALTNYDQIINFTHMQTNILYINSIAAKNEQLFPNAKKFDPGRWARDKPDPFAILPFGFGPRSCYGQSILLL